MKKFKKPKKFDVNTIVIGAGAAGLVSSIIFAIETFVARLSTKKQYLFFSIAT